MTKHIYRGILFCAVLASSSTYGQYATDALRYSESDLTGSARFQSLGGNHSSLGGDPSSIHGNPAGLGFYTRSEFTFTPGVTPTNTKTSYLGDNNSASKGNLNIAQASLVIASQPGFQRKWKRSSLGISFSRQQSFRDHYTFTGYNDKSAYLDNVVQNANADGVTTEQLEKDFESSPANGGGPIAYSLPAAYYQMYLINPTSNSGPPYNALDRNSAVEQSGSYTATGANTQWTIAYAGNYNDKLFIGANFGFSRLRYTYDRTFRDSYVDSPELLSIEQNEALTVTGNGFNLSLGVIYKFTPIFQLGGVITTPTFSSIKETFTQNVNVAFVDNLVTGPDGKLITPPYTSLPIAPNDFVYSLTSPLKGSLGATVFIQDKGFITGSFEFQDYGMMSARTSYLTSTENQSFKSDTKAEIEDTFGSSYNFRLGGEFRANIFRARLGAAYIGDPYLNNDGIKRDKLLLSAGLGVRKSRFFADISGTLSSFKSAYTPYTLNNAEDFASVEITHKPVNVALTFGVNF
jgi:hypothetical protein